MPLENPFYTAEMQGDHQLHSLGRCELEDGGVISDLQLAVATYGELNEAKDNAILVPPGSPARTPPGGRSISGKDGPWTRRATSSSW